MFEFGDTVNLGDYGLFVLSICGLLGMITARAHVIYITHYVLDFTITHC